MTKVTYERGKTMTYPTMYPRLLVTPIFAHENDFMWIEKIVCKYDTETDVDEPEFSFRRDTVHSERNDALKAENAKLRELCKDIWNDALHFEGFWDYVHDDGTIYREDELPHYQERMRKLGIEVC